MLNVPRELEIIYEDNHLLAVNKPAGMLTQPSGTDQESVEALAKQWIKEKYQKPGQVFLEAVHRLDKPVSGVVLFARTSKALSRLNASMREKNTLKRYEAFVEGKLPSSEGTLEHYLVHDDYQASVVSKSNPQAKLARLHYRVLHVENHRSHVEVTLETGRYHQIRVQLAAIGSPIVGDKKYGSKIPWEKEGIALHHARLEIPHPITGEIVILNAPWSL